MASPNNNLNVLPWYTSLTQQNSNKWYAFGNVWPLVMPVTRLVPYQFVVPYTGVTVSSSQIINMETGRSYSGASHAVISRDSYSVIQSAGTNFSSSLPEGRYYGRITLSNGSTYYSEIFTLVEDMSGYIKIQYWNDDDMYYQGGEISYSNSFRFEMYLCTTIGKPEYNFEEEVTSRLGYKFPELQVSNKVYKFTCVAPEFICDAMRLIRMSDYIQITDHYGEVYNALTFAYEAKWETQGDVASVEAEFETDNIIQKLESFNRRVRDSFYNALLTDTEEALKFDEATVAQYYNDYMSTFDTSGLINGKMIRELVSGEGVTDTTYIAVDYGVGTAKKLSLKTILGGVGGGLDPEAMWAELKKENSDRLIHPSHFGLLNRMFTALDKDGNEVPFDDKVVVEKDENGETVVKDAISSIRANYDFWGVASVSAKGKSTGGGGGGGGGGLIQTVYGFTDFTNGTEFSADDNSSTFNAYAINELYKMAKEGGGIKGLTVTGDGNVLTGGSLSADGKTITLSKNYTAISQQDGDARYAKKGDTVTRQMISKLFTALSADGTEVDITTDEAISSIRANYDFWGVASVSAKGKSTGGGGGGGGASALYQLADVLQNSSGDGVSGASEGKALVFDGSHWYAADAGLNESQLGAYLSLNKYLKQVDADGKYALKTIRVSAGTGLTGGGSLNTDVTLSLGESGVTAGTYTKVTTDIYGRVTKGEALAAADVPSLDWSKITTGKPNTLSGYGIIDAYTRKEANEEFVTVSSGQTVTGAKTFTQEMRVCGIAPLSDLMYDIGSASRRIRSMYSKNAEFTESVRIGDILLVYDATNKMVRVKYKDDTASGGLYTDGSLSAKGASTGGGGGGGGTLDGLLDVNIQNAADKQILVYNALQGKWVNSSPGSGLDAAAMWAELQRADSSKVIDISHIPVSTLDGKYVKKAGDTMTGVLSSVVATGTAPFSVISNTRIPNLNADLLDGFNADRFLRTDGGHIFTNLIGGNGTNPGWRQVIDCSGIPEWSINDLTLLIASRHQGTGILAISLHTHNSTGFSASVRYSGSYADLNTQSWRAFYHTTEKRFRLFWYYYDHSNCYVSILNNKSMFTVTFGSWYDTLPSNLGTEITAYYNLAESAYRLLGTRTLWGQSFDGTANVSGNMTGVGSISMSGVLSSSVATGTAPFSVASSTRVANLNADLLDGIHGQNFVYHKDTDFDPATYDGYYMGMTTKSGINSNWWHIISMNWSNSNAGITGDKTWVTQVALPTRTARGLKYRTGASATSYSAWVDVIDSNNYAGTMDARYVRKAGDTMTGPLNFANGTINTIGDDCRFGDYNETGCVGFQGNNGVTGISLLQYNTAWGTSGNRYRMTWNGSNMSSSSTALWNNLNADLLDGVHQTAFLMGYNNTGTKYRLGPWGGSEDLNWRWVVRYVNTGGGTYRACTVKGTIWHINGNHNQGQAIGIPFQAVFYAYGGTANSILNSSTLYLPYNVRWDLIRIVRYANNSWELQMRQPGAWSLISAEYTVRYNGGTVTAGQFSTTDIHSSTVVNSYNLNKTYFDDQYVHRSGYADRLSTPRTINGTSFDGSADITTSYWGTTRTFYINSHDSYRSGGATNVNGSGNVTLYLPNSIRCSDWFRSTGSSGWYNDTYGGGIYMHDSSWVRVFGGKRFYVANADNTDFSTISALSTEGGIHAVKNITTNANMFARGSITAKASSSDIRLKTDIQPYNAVGIIKRFRSVKYHWNDTAKKNSEVFNHDEWNYGLIAQDLIKGGFGQWVKDVFKDYYTIDYERIIPVLWKGVQEVDSEVSRLRREVACLRKRIYNLEKRIRA